MHGCTANANVHYALSPAATVTHKRLGKHEQPLPKAAVDDLDAWSYTALLLKAGNVHVFSKVACFRQGGSRTRATTGSGCSGIILHATLLVYVLATYVLILSPASSLTSSLLQEAGRAITGRRWIRSALALSTFGHDRINIQHRPLLIWARQKWALSGPTPRCAALFFH